MPATVSVAVQQPIPRTKAPDVVWTWSKRCNGDHRLGVTIRLDRKVLYRGVLNICRGSRDAEDGQAELHFAGGHTFQSQYHTSPNESIEGDIWEAGGDPNFLILGIAFFNDKQILLNTVDIARPAKQTSSEIDANLSITTFPVPAR